MTLPVSVSPRRTIVCLLRDHLVVVLLLNLPLRWVRLLVSMTTTFPVFRCFFISFLALLLVNVRTYFVSIPTDSRTWEIPYCCPKNFFLNDISHLLRRIVSVLLRVSGEHRGQGTHSAAMERKIFIFLPRFLMLSEDSEVPDAFISVYRHCDLTHIGV